jgi:hypothetical protein
MNRSISASSQVNVFPRFPAGLTSPRAFALTSAPGEHPHSAAASFVVSTAFTPAPCSASSSNRVSREQAALMAVSV